MATFSITTTGRQDAGAQFATQRHNDARLGDTVTVAQFVRQRINEMFDRWADQFDQDTKESKGVLYQRASDADKAAVNAILDRYRT